MSARQSITASETFAARAQRSEATRASLWLAVLVGMMVITLTRRGAGGVVMSTNRLFVPYIGVLILAAVLQIVLLKVLKDANRQSRLLPGWLWKASAIFDLCVASALLIIPAYLSPRGPIAALSAPPLLLPSLVILMSVLRLRPKFTLLAGLSVAILHLLLAVRATRVSGLPLDPVYFAYGAILILTAISGAAVSRQMREHVREAANEAAAHERVGREMERMNFDLDVAREIQQGLLPKKPPQIEGFEIAGMNRPADQTGGDYYDWQELPNGQLAVVLADVSGHGIGPAIVMAICRAYARSSAPSLTNPKDLLEQINRLIQDDLPADRFITLVTASLRPDGGLHLASAGHGPTLLYSASKKTVTKFLSDGAPLGVIPNEEYGPTQELVLDEGDALMMVTDGFFEWHRPGDRQQFGTERLEEAFRASAHADAAAILRSVDEAVCAFCKGAKQEDDMTAIVIKRTAKATAITRTDAAPSAADAIETANLVTEAMA